jgi:hypothetical protein
MYRSEVIEAEVMVLERQSPRVTAGLEVNVHAMEGRRKIQQKATNKQQL